MNEQQQEPDIIFTTFDNTPILTSDKQPAFIYSIPKFISDSILSNTYKDDNDEGQGPTIMSLTKLSYEEIVVQVRSWISNYQADNYKNYISNMTTKEGVGQGKSKIFDYSEILTAYNTYIISKFLT